MKIISETADELVLGNTAYVPTFLGALFVIAGAYATIALPKTGYWWVAPAIAAMGIIAMLASLRSFYKFTFSRHAGTVRRSYAMGLLGRPKEWQLAEISGVSAVEFEDVARWARTPAAPHASGSPTGPAASYTFGSPGKPITSSTYGWVVKLKLNDGTSLELNTRTSKNKMLGGSGAPENSREVKIAEKIGQFLKVPVEIIRLPATKP
ncbi:MAG: hypothetical protein WC759_04450 [Candidatus Micrarchaeia archaeon]|jgi:hypothetical protein